MGKKRSVSFGIFPCKVMKINEILDIAFYYIILYVIIFEV